LWLHYVQNLQYTIKYNKKEHDKIISNCDIFASFSHELYIFLMTSHDLILSLTQKYTFIFILTVFYFIKSFWAKNHENWSQWKKANAPKNNLYTTLYTL
jgi:hypothetical protein